MRPAGGTRGSEAVRRLVGTGLLALLAWTTFSAGSALSAAPPTGGTPAAGAQARASAGDSVSLAGAVRAEGFRADGRLPGALVEVRQGGRTRTVVADARGDYRVEGLARGSARVQVFHLATRPFEVEVRLPGAGEMTLDLELERRIVPLAGIEVVDRSRNVETIPVALGRVSADVLTRGPRTLEGSSGMVEAGLVRAIAPLPSDGEPGSDRVLFMRGSTVDARTVFLDGAPVLTPFHVAGLVPAFEPSLVGRANVFPGGAPPRYEGGLSHLIDVETRTPRTEGVGGGLAVDGLLAKGSVELGLPGGGGLLVAGRSLHGRQGTLGSRDRFPYRYEDLLVRGHLPLGGGHAFGVTVYRNEEGVGLDELLVEDGEASWGNLAASARYAGRLGRVEFAAVSAASRYDSALPLVWRDPVVARASSRRGRSALDVVVPMEGWRLRTGASVDRFLYIYRLDPRAGEWTGFIAAEPIEMGVGALGGYAEASIPLGERLRLDAGFRADLYVGKGPLRIGPRASLHADLTDEATLLVAAGRYHQPVPVPGLMGDDSRDEHATLLWNPRLPIAEADHLVVTLEQSLDSHLELGVSGFVKAFSSPPGAGAGARLRSSGTDLRIARNGDRLGAWIGYALSWFWEEEGVGGSSTFSGRHLVSAGLRGTPFEGLEAGVTLGYGAGLPFASLPLPSTPVSGVPTLNSGDESSRKSALSNAAADGGPLEVAPRDDFLRLDLDVRWLVEPTIAGRSARLRPYLRVMNALDSRDALFQYLDRWRDGELRPVGERAFLPVIGIEWRF